MLTKASFQNSGHNLNLYHVTSNKDQLKLFPYFLNNKSTSSTFQTIPTHVKYILKLFKTNNLKSYMQY